MFFDLRVLRIIAVGRWHVWGCSVSWLLVAEEPRHDRTAKRRLAPLRVGLAAVILLAVSTAMRRRWLRLRVGRTQTPRGSRHISKIPTFSFSRQATKGGKRPCARPRRVAAHGRVRLEIRALGERRSTRSTVKVKVYGFAVRGAYRTMILLSYYMP